MKKNVIQMKPAMKTPVTYYGGKQRMLSIILPMIPEHQIFVEPFVGGGAVFFAKEPAKVELINDKNGEVVNFYNVVKTRFPELKELVDATLHSEKQQKETKHIYSTPKPSTKCAERGRFGCFHTKVFIVFWAARGSAEKVAIQPCNCSDEENLSPTSIAHA